MVGMMMLTFLFFFCFVVNIGMLVNAKINLQNAADFAAYAGAAAQARQLNTISYLNYEMRRQYKKFLFRYYVIGNMAQDSASTTISDTAGNTPRAWKPSKNSTIDFQVPMVCMIFNAADNFCHVPKSPAINAPVASNFDAINSALIQQLANIEQVRQNNCVAIGATNQLVLWLWLFNSDPNVATLAQQLGAIPSLASRVPVIQGLGQGLGLVPRELILAQRIKTVMGYVNTPPQSGVTLDSTQGLRNGVDPSQNERTIQAFLSAYLTLGNHSFSDPTQIVMDELMPAKLLNLKPIKVGFDAYALDFFLDKKAAQDASAGAIGINAADCTPKARLQQIPKDDLVVGFAKDPTLLTYYAIRLTATAKVLFNPFGGDVQLKAYSVARPFGSRIGPILQTDNWVWTNANPPNGTLTTQNTLGQTGTLAALEPLGQIPNLPIQATDGTGSGQGWDVLEAQGTYFGEAFSSILTNPDPANAGTPLINATALAAAYQLAMAPNPAEEGLYNIPSDLPIGGQGTAGWTHFAPMYDGLKQMALWAPIVPPASGGSIDSTLQTSLQELFQGAGSSNPDPTGAAATAAFLAAMQTEIATYVNQNLQNNGGEDGETVNTVHLKDPFFTIGGPNNPPPVPLTLPEWVMPDPDKDRGKILTSWNAPNDPKWLSEQKIEGRGGYSVKFVTLDSVNGGNSTQTSDAGDKMTNPLAEDVSGDIGVEMSH
jgi:hypothetical protein